MRNRGLTNNSIYKKIKIALQLRENDVVEAIRSRGVDISKSRVQSFGVGVDHKNYQHMHDEELEALLDGLIKKLRG